MSKGIQKKLNELWKLAELENVNILGEIEKLQRKLSGIRESTGAWHRVEMARKADRPTSLQLIQLMSDEFQELHGDRAFGDDPAVVGGIAVIGGTPVTFIGHQKGRTLKENLFRNYGMAHPEGYRKALRLAREAEKFGRPVITLIDTAGAYPGITAEERGIGQSIAKNLKSFSMLRVPVICFVIGEGGSGGALGIGVGDEVYMLENAIYSVITPEGCASILLRDPSRAEEAAGYMRLTAMDLLEFGIIDGIIPEPPGGAGADPAAVAESIRRRIIECTVRLKARSFQRLLKDRAKRFRNIGAYRIPEKKPRGFMRRLFRSLVCVVHGNTLLKL